MITDQAAALAAITSSIRAETWQADRVIRWTAVLRRLVLSADWSTGLISGCTVADLVAAGGSRCSPRTVSRILAWARHGGLLVVVEGGASADFLGGGVNRAPSYAFVDPRPTSPDAASAQVSDPVTDFGDLPLSPVCKKPLNGRMITRRRRRGTEWSRLRIPETPWERAAAAALLRNTIGLPRSVTDEQLHGALLRWWEARWCVAAVIYASSHHPITGRYLGCSTRGARNPLATLLARLRPWQDRLNDLPENLRGRRDLTDAAVPPPAPPASADARAAARAEYAQHRAKPGDGMTALGRVLVTADEPDERPDHIRRSRWSGAVSLVVRNATHGVVGIVEGLADQRGQVITGAAIDHAAAVATSTDQPGQAQTAQVLRNRRTRRGDLRGECGHVLLGAQQPEEMQPGRIGEVPEDLGRYRAPLLHIRGCC